jgi:integrase
MKDVRLLFRVHGRKFYLGPPRRPGGPYYIRFEPPSNHRTRIRVVHRSLRTNVIATAKARAKLIIEPILKGQWEIAEKLKSRAGYSTIGELLERYQAGAGDRPNTVRNNSSALRLIVRTVHAGDADKQSSSVLTAELIRHFERIRMAAAKSEPDRHRTRASIRSYVVQARSVVAPRKMRFYEDLNLPDLNSFRNEKVEMPKRTKPRALDIGVISAINAAAQNLAAFDPAVYVAFLLFSRLGLRNVEIRNARWHWIQNGRIGIIDRPEENFYPKGSEGWVPIAPDVLKELMRFRDATRDILKVRDFLRHASVETTQQWYAYLLDDVPSIGMNDFVPALRVQY